MHEYDITLKLLLREPAGLVTRELAGPIARWLNVELPELQNTRVDLLGETVDGGLVHIELQSSNDVRMALRMAEYFLRVYRLFGKFPRQVLLYVGSDALRMDTELRAADFSFRYQFADIRDLDGASLLQSACISDNVIAILAQLRDRRTAVREVVEKLASLELGAREFHLRALLMLAGLRNWRKLWKRRQEKCRFSMTFWTIRFWGASSRRGSWKARPLCCAA